MALKNPKGTEDMFGRKAEAWTAMQNIAEKIFKRYNYNLITTPIFEQRETFTRGIGQATDVVEKEMFEVFSKDAATKLRTGETLKEAQNLALRPEGTAGVIRAAIQNGLASQNGPVTKLMYAGPMFRCENTQKLRLRQFNQIGVEYLGAKDPAADAEIITMMMRFYEELGIPANSMRLLINSMGDDYCRANYRNKLREYLAERSDELCEDCRRRAEINPLRVFDCKNAACTDVMVDAPKVTDELCDDCRENYETIKLYLDLAGIAYEEDPTLVRGLDYYTSTVFEVQVVDGLGSQNAIGGGGRYDKLVEIMGGKPTPGIGFAIGFERTLAVLEALNIDIIGDDEPLVYVATVDDTCRVAAFFVAMQFRDMGVRVEMDNQGRSIKSQFKQADKLGSKYTIVIGPDELENGCCTIRLMETGDEKILPLDEVAFEVANVKMFWD